MEITAASLDAPQAETTRRNALIEQNARLVPYALNPLLQKYPGLSDADREDVLGAGYLSLCYAADLYQIGGRAAFSTFAHHVIVWAGRTALARHIGNPKARRHGFSVVSLDALASSGVCAADRLGLSDLIADQAAPDPFGVLLQKEETQTNQRLWEWALPHLTRPQAQAVWLCYGEGRTSAQVAQQLGVSRQTVTGLLKNALARLQRAAQRKRNNGSEMFRQDI